MTNVLSLFPGIGLLDYAFESEGFTVYRGPDVIWGGDIRRFHPAPLIMQGVIGGPPCQSFSSLAHLVRANGHEPKFGNLIPEFERCVGESECDWFVMENVPQAPEPVVTGYATRSFLLDNSMLAAGDDGFGHEQIRKRRFTFGVRGPGPAPDLRRWIDLAVFVLPDAERTSTSWPVNNTVEAKGRTKAVFGDGRPTRQEARHQDEEGQPCCRRCRRPTVPCLCGYCGKCCHLLCKSCKCVKAIVDEADAQLEEVRQECAEWAETGVNPLDKPKTRRQAVVSDPSAVPVKIGGSGKVKRTRQVTVTSTDGGVRPSEATRSRAVSSNLGGMSQEQALMERGRGRYRLADALRLQGLPADFLDHCPFTAEGKLKAVANGVPVMMGRAIAKAVLEATKARDA